ncbi:MAG: ATPase domain-containing protein [Steroidobacteraceae bacterium]
MLGGRGFYRGSAIFVSGSAGTGKTSLAGSFADAACRRGEYCLYFLLEESPLQMIRNMRSIGLDLSVWVERGLLHLQADRPSRFGIEAHLSAMYRSMEAIRPQIVVVDSITDLLSLGAHAELRAMRVRLIDHLKTQAITALFNSLTPGAVDPQESNAAVSSLMDAWLLFTLQEAEGRRLRRMAVLKSRGMAHSNRVYEFKLTQRGFEVPGLDAEHSAGGSQRAES